VCSKVVYGSSTLTLAQIKHVHIPIDGFARLELAAEDICGFPYD
jgi:hypothetical protein